MRISVELNTDWMTSRDLVLHFIDIEDCPHCGSNHKKLPTNIRGRFFNKYYYVECPSTKNPIDLTWS